SEPVAIRAVVFDLDGTLVDSMPLVLRAFAHALEPFRAPLAPMELFARLGGPPDRTFLDLLGNEPQAKEALQRLISFSKTHWQLIQPFAGMDRLLAELQHAEFSLGLWTGRERESTEWILREQQIAARLRTVVCGDDLPTHKPHPGGLAEILRRFAVAREATLFVGDGDVDVLAGAALGVRTLLIRHGRAVGAEVLAKAWRVVETPDEAYAVVRATVQASV
ncbi:MAG: HAD hydrolase-like protein, partial [Opitutaceae bacterium]|nr:HAD hydrolase-like protein [Opitutaceae bacterium]